MIREYTETTKIFAMKYTGDNEEDIAKFAKATITEHNAGKDPRYDSFNSITLEDYWHKEWVVPVGYFIVKRRNAEDNFWNVVSPEDMKIRFRINPPKQQKRLQK